ncbi:MAG: hypothetical protein C4B58_02560 [Deltaproteobacteria bacterium]|nr:MAG: hypothetical protein C4B58_02560 [Deltaproteobacteria bacterium]
MTASGDYKIDACMKLLEKLESKGFVKLPEKQQRSQRQQSEKHIALTSKTEAQADEDYQIQEEKLRKRYWTVRSCLRAEGKIWH